MSVHRKGDPSIVKKGGNDEFYTMISTIENHVVHFAEHFKNKVVYCNCDNYLKSNFWRYFYDNFHQLGLKCLIATEYVSQTVKVINDDTRHPVCAIYDGSSIGTHNLKGNGDFRSKECVDILDECDIVCTNPPFSLSADFYRTVRHKDFLIIGVITSVYGRPTDSDSIPKRIVRGKVNVSYCKPADFIRPCGRTQNINAVWYTTFDDKRTHPFLPLTKKYNPADYPKYDNYDAIECNRLKNIPYDYDELIGVPTTILPILNRKQFELVDIVAYTDATYADVIT